MKLKYITVAVLFWGATFNAQEKVSEVDEVIVQGKFLTSEIKKSNFSLDVITREDIANSPAATVEDLLQFHSGMDIRRRGANAVQTDVAIRGGSFEQVLILLNGIRMNDSQTGHNSMNIPVDLSAIERIEIVKGPAARRYGQGAYAGVINIVTKLNAENKVKVSVEGGDFGTYSLGTTARFGRGKLNNLFQISRSASDGYRHNTDSEITNVYYENRIDIHNGEIGLQGGFVEKKFGANGFYASPLATEQYEEVQASVVALKYRQKFNRWSLNANTFWRRGQDMYLYNREKPEIYRNMHIGNTYGVEMNTTYQSQLGLTGLGAEWRNEELVSSNLGRPNRKVIQLFLEHHFSFVQDKLKITPGVSWANYSEVDDFFYPGIDVGYTVNENHHFFANTGRVNRLPSFTDLYYVSPTEEGNPDLKPENGWSSEVGYKYNRSNFGFKANLFLKTTKEAIDWTKAPGSNVWKAYNIGHLTSKGFEVETHWLAPQILDSKINVSYTFLENTYKNNSEFSRYLIDNLKHQFIARWYFQPIKGFSNELSYRYLERVNASSYQVLDEKLSYKNGRIETYILINNLTNTKFTEAFGVPMPGRWFHLGISYDIL